VQKRGIVESFEDPFAEAKRKRDDDDDDDEAPTQLVSPSAATAATASTALVPAMTPESPAVFIDVNEGKPRRRRVSFDGASSLEADSGDREHSKRRDRRKISIDVSESKRVSIGRKRDSKPRRQTKR
jgi:hypothetical protein